MRMRRLLFLGIFSLMCAGALFAEETDYVETLSLKDGTAEWNVAVSFFDTQNISLENRYLASSLPLKIYTTLLNYQTHIFSDEERMKYAEKIIENARQTILKEAADLRKSFDELDFEVFKSSILNARQTKEWELLQKRDELNKKIRFLAEFKPEDIKINPERTIVVLRESDSSELFAPVIDKQKQFAEEKKADLLIHISKDRVRDEFVRIVTGENAAKAIEAAEGTGVLKWVTGIDKPLKRLNPLQLLNPNSYLNISERNAATLKDYRILLSLCVFYRRYFEEDALEAVEYLNYSGKTAKVIKDAIMTGNRLANISDKFEIKEYIAEYGFEFYDLMEDVLRIEGESDSKTAKMRRARLEAAAEIQRENEPLTIKDLAVKGDDITKLGATGKTVGLVLEHLAKQVRRNPEINDREKLLKIAEEMMKWNLK